MEAEILFTESQRFRQTWLWILLIGLSVFFILLDIRQFFIGAAEGSLMAAQEQLLTSSAIILLICVFLYIIRLETIIKTDGIYVRFFPFTRGVRKHEWADISQVRIRQYNALWEYGGWGLRFGFGNGKAYTISGNQGIQLVFNDGSRLLIGTQCPDEADEALKRIRTQD